MSDSLLQCEEKPGRTSFTSKSNTTIIHHAGAVHLGAGDNITLSKGIMVALFWLFTHA